MRNRLKARDVVAAAAARINLPLSSVDEIFDHAPLDFPVIFSDSLPLFAHRFGMVGITIRGRVWLLTAVNTYDPATLIALIRHEAEHVRQQALRPLTFYARYAGGFLRQLVAPAARRTASRFQRAYLSIPYEREAYAAGSRAVSIITRDAQA